MNKHRRLRVVSRIVAFFIAALAATNRKVEGTITLAELGIQYQSTPAPFGKTFDYGLEYVARLQVLRNGDEFACGKHGNSGDLLDNDDHIENADETVIVVPRDQLAGMSHFTSLPE